MIKTLLLICLYLGITHGAFGQSADRKFASQQKQRLGVQSPLSSDLDCLSLYTGPLWNPNAVYYDTCSGSPTYGERYSKVGYDFLFDHYIFSSLLTPVDTVTRTWADIDTSYAAVRAAFQTIETRFGSYVFVKQFPSDVDTASYFTRWFRLQFDQLVCVDSVVTALKAINVGEPNYDGGPYPFNRVWSSDTNAVTLYPNPASDLLYSSCFGSAGSIVLTSISTGTSFNLPIAHLGSVPFVDVSRVANGSYLLRSEDQTFRLIITH